VNGALFSRIAIQQSVKRRRKSGGAISGVIREPRQGAALGGAISSLRHGAAPGGAISGVIREPRHGAAPGGAISGVINEPRYGAALGSDRSRNYSGKGTYSGQHPGGLQEERGSQTSVAEQGATGQTFPNVKMKIEDDAVRREMDSLGGCQPTNKNAARMVERAVCDSHSGGLEANVYCVRKSSRTPVEEPARRAVFCVRNVIM